jgi:hypothetical protein
VKSINDLDIDLRAEFETRRAKIREVAKLVELAGLRGKIEGLYFYYEGSDYIGIETFSLDVLRVVRNKLEQVMGESSVSGVFELTDGRINAFYKFPKYPIFSLRLIMSPETFPIDDVLPGSKIVNVGGSKHEVIKA